MWTTWRRIVALGLAVGAGGCFGAMFVVPFVETRYHLDFPGWFTTPLRVMGVEARFRDWLVAKIGVPEGPRYLYEMVRELLTGEDWAVGLAVLLFSIVLPAAKIGLVVALVLADAGTPFSRVATGIMHAVSRWAMADVFIVGWMIVFVKAEAFHMQFTARAGLWLYVTCAMASAIAATIIDTAPMSATRPPPDLPQPSPSPSHPTTAISR